MSLLFIFVKLRERVGKGVIILARALNEKRRWPLVQVSSPPPGHGAHVTTLAVVPGPGANTVEGVWETGGERG